MNSGVKKRYVIILFLSAVIAYGIIALFFTSTVHVQVDEDLYVALAKSFHYKGRFEAYGDIMNYNCVLYSMLISVAYYFYSPEHILFLMRFIGILSMCSAVFPIYLLAKRILQDDRISFAISALTLIMPYMFDGMYLLQEVLSYPLFLWTMYFLYRAFETSDMPEAGMWMAVGAVFSVLCFFTKTYLFLIPVTVNCCFILWLLRREEGRNVPVKALLIYDILYLLGTALLYLMINMINGGAEGSNHYTGQFSTLFPLSVQTFISGAVCCIVYASLLFLNMGVLPIGTLVFNRNRLREDCRRFRDFCLAACILLVLEIIFLIVLTEEGVPTIPHKFLFRYYQVLVPPVLIIFVGQMKEEDYLKNKVMRLLSGICFAVGLCYFGYMGGITRQGIADGYLYLTLENITKYILPYADAAAVVLAGAATAVLIGSACRGRSGVVKRTFKLGVAGIILFWILNCVQLPIYTNIWADGKTIQNDSIKIAEYLGTDDCDLYYLVVSGEDETGYLRNFYGYVRQTYSVIDSDTLEEMMTGEKTGEAFYLISSRSDLNTERTKRIDLGTERLYLYVIYDIL